MNPTPENWEVTKDPAMALALARSVEEDEARSFAELQVASLQGVTVSQGKPGGVSLPRLGSFNSDETTVCPIEHEHCLTGLQIHHNRLLV